jgi:hypothetical protein
MAVWYDESFKERLLTDPKSAIEEEFDVELPDDLQVTVLEEAPDTLFLLLPGKGCSVSADHGNGSRERALSSERDLRAELSGKANQDGAFRQELLADPRRAIEKELGIPLPEHLRVTVAEETPTRHFLLLPINRTVLNEEPLNTVVGGTTGDCATNCCNSYSYSGCGGTYLCCNSCNSSSNCCW